MIYSVAMETTMYFNLKADNEVDALDWLNTHFMDDVRELTSTFDIQYNDRVIEEEPNADHYIDISTEDATDISEYIGCDFYDIYEENGEKRIKILGYVYAAQDGSGEYRHQTFRDFDRRLEDFISEGFDYDEEQSSERQYVEVLTESETISVLENYTTDGIEEMAYAFLNINTPCGRYVNYEGRRNNERILHNKGRYILH